MNDNSNNMKSRPAQVGPVTAAIRAIRSAELAPWESDGSDRQEWDAADWEARRAIAQGFHDRAELLELSTAAFRGPVELARRMRNTEFGGGDFPRRRSFSAYLAYLFGEGVDHDGPYAQSFTYRLQLIRPFIARVH